MIDPKQHAESRGTIESILRFIPGFAGYLEKEYRRESDALARSWLAGRLDRSKKSLDDYGRNLVDLGQIDQLAMIDRLRARLDQTIGKLRGAMPGYSGFFDFVQVADDQLDDVYDHDMSLISQVDEFAAKMEGLPTSSETPAVAIPDLLNRLDGVLQQINDREDLLKGLASNPPSQ